MCTSIQAGMQVRCDGTEERLVDCRHSKQEDCGPGEVTLVVCSGLHSEKNYETFH